MDVKKFSEMVFIELNEMKKLGMRVPYKAIEMSKDHELMKEYTSMKTSECADLIIMIAEI